MRHRFKYIAKLVFVASVIGGPIFAQAACLADGYTVVFVNGIKTSESDANLEKIALAHKLSNQFNNQPLTTILGYNTTHWNGDGDVIETLLPQFDQYDLDTILMQMGKDVQTRKLLIVGYSQGAMYANRLYDYLITHGEPADAVAIYGVATPETILSSKGNYLNYEGDTTIYNSNFQVGAVVPPPPNVFFKDWWNDPNAKGDNEGHDFVTAYLNNFADRVVSGIKSEMFVLRPTNATATGACFVAPTNTLGRQAEGVGLAMGEPASVVLNTTATIGGGAVIGAVGFLSDLTASVAGLFTPKPKTPDPNKARAANDAGTALLNALNLTSLTVKAADELQGGDNNNLGGAAILAFGPDQPAPGEVLGSSTEATDTPPVATSTASTSPPAVFVPDPSTVHLNAPAFDGQAASPPAESPDTTTGTGDASTTDNTASTTPDVASSTPPALTPPVITFSNWAVSDEARLCDVPPRFVDIAWDAPGATSYDIYTQDVEDQYMNLFNKTRDIGVLSFSVPVGIYRMIPTNLIVVAHNDADDAATTTVRLDTAIPDNAPPQMLSLSPALFATGVSTTTSIAVTFDEPIATSTVNDVSARMNDAARTYNVDRTVSLSLDGKTITITPTSPLAYSTRFNIALTCTISDLYGNRLPYDMGIVMDPSSQYFTTEAAPAAATSTP